MTTTKCSICGMTSDEAATCHRGDCPVERPVERTLYGFPRFGADERKLARHDHGAAEAPLISDAFVAVGSTRFSDGALQTEESLVAAQSDEFPGAAPASSQSGPFDDDDIREIRQPRAEGAREGE